MSDPVLVSSGPALAAAGLAHAVRRPAQAGPHPTAVLIHGRAGDEKVMWIFARTLPSEKDWLIVAPRAPLADPGSGYSWHRPQPDGFPNLAGFDEAVSALKRFAGSLPNLYGADPDRLYFMGFSQGAATALATAARFPRAAGGVAALMGFMPPGGDEAGAKAALAGLPIYLAAGLRDPTISIALARESARWLEAAGARLEYHEYDSAHKMNAAALADLKEWWRWL